jgi:hypothetical protein
VRWELQDFQHPIILDVGDSALSNQSYISGIDSTIRKAEYKSGGSCKVQLGECSTVRNNLKICRTSHLPVEVKGIRGICLLPGKQFSHWRVKFLTV